MKDVLSMTEYETKDGQKKTRWSRVGIAFPNRDGSMNIILDAFPINGRLQVRDRDEKPQPEAEEAF